MRGKKAAGFGGYGYGAYRHHCLEVLGGHRLLQLPQPRGLCRLPRRVIRRVGAQLHRDTVRVVQKVPPRRSAIAQKGVEAPGHSCYVWDLENIMAKEGGDFPPIDFPLLTKFD